MVPPLRLGNSGALPAITPRRCFQARITITVDRQSGTVRCLRPLPVRWIDGEVSRIRFSTRALIISETRAPVL
jgi:hypothetical protein